MHGPVTTRIMKRLMTLLYFKKIATYWSFVGFTLSSLTSLYLIALVDFKAIPAIALSGVFSYFLFRNTLNTVQSVGSFYWITRDFVAPQSRIISSGFMHEIDSPWRHGKGIQIALFKKTLQVGFCKQHDYDETSGVLAAVQGRFMDETAHEIGNW